MQTDQITINVSVALTLRDVISALLYTRRTKPDGEEYYIDRDLPFRLRYRLNKNKVLFDKDADDFNKARLFAIAKYGEPSEDGQNVVIKDPQKQNLFRQEITHILEAPLSHSVVKLEPDDLDLIKDTDIPISPEAMSLFIGYMTNDPELERQLNEIVDLSVKETPVVPVTETVEQTTDTPAVEEAPKTEEPVKTEEAPVKKTTRKTSTKKATETATSEKTEETAKKTTARKPRTKKATERT